MKVGDFIHSKSVPDYHGIVIEMTIKEYLGNESEEVHVLWCDGTIGKHSLRYLKVIDEG